MIRISRVMLGAVIWANISATVANSAAGEAQPQAAKEIKGFAVALAFYEDEDYQQALKLLLGKRFSEDAKSLFLLGEIYQNADKEEHGFAADEKKAKGYYLKAAHKGHLGAMHSLGWMASFQDDVQGMEKWWGQAGSKGHFESTWELSNHFILGKNPKAIELLNRLTKTKDYRTMALVKLGHIYSRGLGVQSDLQKALTNYRAAFVDGDPTAKRNLGLKFYKGYAEAQDHYENGEFKKALKLLLDKSFLAEAKVNFLLGEIYQNAEGEDGIAADEKKSRAYFLKAAQMGHPKALYELGSSAYLDDDDDAAAEKWWSQAVAKGHLESTWDLSDMYFDAGNPKAIPLLERLLKVNDYRTRAQLKLGRIYSKGVGVNPDYKKALAYFRAAEASGSAGAKASLAFMYYKGLGVKKDLPKALRMLKEADKKLDMWEEPIAHMERELKKAK